MEIKHHSGEQDKTQSEDWQRDMINRLAFSSLKEQRAARRWGIFFKLLMFAYLALILYLYTPKVDMDVAEGTEHTALIDLEGVIASDEDAEARRARVAAYQYFMPIGRLSSPDEQAAAIAFLASEDASYINGVALDVNGGLFMA